MTRAQALEAGMSGRQIGRALGDGRMCALHPGVYLVGPVLGRRARQLAAVLACAPRAALSHRSAAHLWQLLPHPTQPIPTDVSVAGRNPGARAGIGVHRVSSLRREEVTVQHAITVTTPTRTLLDLSGSCGEEELEQAIAEAYALRLTNRAKLRAAIERHVGSRGVAILRAQIDGDRTPARTRSLAERRLLALIRAAELRRPELNVRLGRWEVDFLWREQRLVVEVDGYASHSSPRAFERDHMKTAELQAAGLTVIRVSARRLRDRPRSVVALIARALSPDDARRG